jgi:hypothetical protein
MVVTAVAYFGDMENGISKPKIMLCDDGITRVVKFNHPPELNRSLFHEFVGHRIAELLDLPVLDQELVYVPPELTDAYSNIEGMSSGIKVGTPLADVDKNLTDNGLFREPFKRLYGSCLNRHVIPGIFAYDIWVHNNDRGSNKGNILVVPDKNGNKQLYIHDHGFAFFEPAATMERYKKLTEFRGAHLDWQRHRYPFGPIYEALKAHVDLTDCSKNPFGPYITRIESISREKLEQIMKDVPQEWKIPEYEKNAVISFLYDRRYAVRMCIDYLVKIFWFPEWNGGELMWPVLHVSSS